MSKKKNKNSDNFKIIKSSTHFINDLNSSKKKILNNLIDEYRRVAQIYIDHYWYNDINFKTSKKIKNELGEETSIEIEKVFSRKRDLLDLPMFGIHLPNIETKLSGRFLKALQAQVLGIIKSIVQKRKATLYLREEAKRNKQRTRYFTRKLKHLKLKKPSAENINPMIDTTHYDLIDLEDKHFNCLLSLEALGDFKEDFNNLKFLYGFNHKSKRLNIPFNKNKHSLSLEQKGRRMSGVILQKDKINLVYEITKGVNKNATKIVGADTGINSVVTLSDKQQISKNKQDQTLNEILKKISRRKKGSKRFKKAIEHRDNFINWSINQINFDNIKEIRLEKVSNFRYKKNVGKFLNYSAEALIRDKLTDLANINGVRIILEDSAYKSQRCKHCGYTYSKNRSNKLFRCKRCLFEADADYNASCNHIQELPSAKFLMYVGPGIKKMIKAEGFLWKPDGIFTIRDEVMQSSKKRNNKISNKT